MYKGNQLNLEEEFLIEKNFLPNSNKVDFDIYDRKYLFRKKENFQKIKIKSIESYFKEEILNKNKPIKNYEEQEISEETDEEEYESEENLSSSFSSLAISPANSIPRTFSAFFSLVQEKAKRETTKKAKTKHIFFENIFIQPRFYPYYSGFDSVFQLH